MKHYRELAQAIPPLLDKLHSSATRLRESLEQLQAAGKPWQHYLLQPGFAQDASLALGKSFEQPFSLTGALYAQLDYLEPMGSGSDARVTLQIPGLLAVPSKTLSLAQQFNAQKKEFYNAISSFRAALEQRPVAERDRSVREVLTQSGHPRAHLRQCYRLILLCPNRPDAIALSWIKARKSIRKVTVGWCEKKLVQLDPAGSDPGIQYQRQLLAGLHKSQQEDLRQVQVQSRPNLQVAEIFYGQEKEQEDAYRQVGYSSMPVLIQANSAGQLPNFTRIDHQPSPSRRRQRRDLGLASEAFLPALRVFLREQR
ncbi:hypothetical protein [Microbulbifer spongiae]|uniref:DNA replication terminus site-binding protein n=1 Tax=Microbulbifer spongiae TaxID=2944933 RepID=A0ABY9E581_9GAMM|nr:hypothetical protein [Microbulbifer sp. MI-G]WKD48180.1 hypothetical protein M8T91_09485 [Microbulbifer sp. MI-G]